MMLLRSNKKKQQKYFPIKVETNKNQFLLLNLLKCYLLPQSFHHIIQLYNNKIASFFLYIVLLSTI